MQIDAAFRLVRETKGALRYEEIDVHDQPIAIGQGAHVGRLYIRKSTLGTERPKKITVTIETTNG